MAYFPDLSPYAYGNGKHPGVVHVGWLDGAHPYKKGHVASSLIESMKKMAETPSELYRGFHLCDLCERDKPRSNGEIRVSRDGLTYAAPILIVHYIEKHGYAPPREFLKALELKPNSPDPTLASGTPRAGQEPRHH